MEPVVNATFPLLLPMLQQLLAAPATSGNQVREEMAGSTVQEEGTTEATSRCMLFDSTDRPRALGTGSCALMASVERLAAGCHGSQPGG